MSSTVCQSSQAVDANSFSRHSNNAGLPLPSIPRRRSSMPSPTTILPFHLPDPVAPSTTTKPQNSSSQTPDEADNNFGSSESRPSGRTLPQRKIQPLLPLQPVEPPHVSTFEFPRRSPVPTASPSAQFFSASQSIPPLALDDPALTTDTAVILNPSPSVDGHIRKKSGEPLKSSLKSRPPTPRPSLTIITGKTPSKSAPATPTHVRSKSVSFAERLDHVKLYLPEQKPIAVSRDGSPTEDTSGTESEAPVSVRKVSSSEKKRLLIMEVVNMPQRWTVDVDVMLEDVTLSKEATICGHVKVRNVAFEKSVAVRFTFDSWQTTSEVVARYEQSLAHGAFDRFSFVIRLHDILAKIEDKTLFMAVRYVVNGQELWDNNSWKNYKMTFSLPIIPRPQGTIAQIQYISDEEAVADLTQKLERVQPMGALRKIQRVQRRKGSDRAEDSFYNSSASLSSRYRWGAALKETRQPPDHSTPSHLKRTAQPASSRSFQNQDRSSNWWLQAPGVTRGSPRLGNDSMTSETSPQDPPLGGLLHNGGHLERPSVRNHKRSSLDVQSQHKLADTGFPGTKNSEVVPDLVPPRDKVSGRFRIPGEFERIPSDDSSATSSSSSSQRSPLVITSTTSGLPSKQMPSYYSSW